VPGASPSAVATGDGPAAGAGEPWAYARLAKPIIATLNQAINAGLADATVKKRLIDLGGTPLPGPAADFGSFVASETTKWGKVVKFANLKPE